MPEYFPFRIRSCANPKSAWYRKNLSRVKDIDINVSSLRFSSDSEFSGRMKGLVCTLQNNSQMLLRERLRRQARGIRECTICNKSKPVQICHVAETRPEHIARAIKTVGTRSGDVYTVNAKAFAEQFLLQHRSEPLVFACKTCHQQLERMSKSVPRRSQRTRTRREIYSP